MDKASSNPFVKIDDNAALLKILSNISFLFTTYNASPDVPTDCDADAMVTRLAEVFRNTEEYRRLLSYKGSTAQRFLDLFILLLDDTSSMAPSFERNVLVAAQRLADKSGMSPTRYQLAGVTRFAVPEASGGFADIYKGYLRGRIVCVKTVRVNNACVDVDLLWKHTLKEGMLWGHLKHPNVLPFYGVYRDKSMISFVAPWMENGDLVRYLKEHEDSNRVMLAYEVAWGLKYLHNKSIVHGDIKAANVLVNDSGRACISDFGFSSILDPGILTWTSQPRPASTGGTLHWQAPEILELELQDEGSAAIHNTKETDIYAFGGLAYEIFVGEAPFSKVSNAYTIVSKVMQGQRPKRPVHSSPSWNVWGLTEDIWSLMEACWDADPLRRPTIDVVVEWLKVALPQGAEEENDGPLQYPGAFQALHRSITDIDMSMEVLESVVASD